MFKFTKLEEKLKTLFRIILSHEFLLAISLTVLLIIVGVILGYENLQKVPATHVLSRLYRQEPNNKLSFMSNWDGPFYIKIAVNGYNKMSLTNFFPLYPLLISFLHKFISSPLYSALLVAWLSLIGVIYYYIKIVKHFFKTESNSEALKAVLLFIVFPSAVFFLATFTESLFAFVSLAAIYYAMKNRYILSGLLGMLATATRPNGVFIVLLTGIILFENKKSLTKIFTNLFLGSLGILSYMFYLYLRYSNPLTFILTQEKHGWLQHLFITQARNFTPLNLIFIIPVIISIFYWWNRKRSFAIYSALFILIPLLGGQFGGFVRYTLMTFPVFLMLYDYLRNKADLYYVTLLLLGIGWTFILLQYTGGYIGG